MLKSLSSFLSSDDGAVNVDWVVLTSAIVLLSATVGASVVAATMETSEGVSDKVAAHAS